MRYFPHAARWAVLLLTIGWQPTDQALHAGGRIEQIAILGTPRAVHTTTVLPSGQLLVAGGLGAGESSLSTAELIDVSTARVTAAGSMAEARATHSATTLPDGRVVLAGGYNGTYLASVEVYDQTLQRFEIMGQLNEGRSGHTATLLPDGRILMVAGVGRGWSFLSSAELFDPSTGRSETVAPLSVPRESHTATLLADGRVLVVGGHRGRREALEVYSSAELYDPATRRFDPVGRLSTARHKHDAVRLADGRVLVLGGADRTDRRHYATTEIYNPNTASFEPGPSMANTRYKINGTAVRLPTDDVLVPSGARNAELLDQRSLAFSTVPGTFPEAFLFATSTLLPSGDVVIVGGYGPQIRNTGGVWRFHLEALEPPR